MVCELCHWRFSPVFSSFYSTMTFFIYLFIYLFSILINATCRIYYKSTMVERDFLQDFAISYETQKLSTKKGSLSVTAMLFLDPVTLVTGTENGNLVIWQFLRKTWELQIVLKSASRGSAHSYFFFIFYFWIITKKKSRGAELFEK